MESEVAGQLRAKGGDEHRALAAQDGAPLNGSQHLDPIADPLNCRSPDEHPGERAIEAVHLQIALEGVDLPPEGVAPDGHIDGAEGHLVRSAVEHFGRQQDHPGAGAEDR